MTLSSASCGQQLTLESITTYVSQLQPTPSQAVTGQKCIKCNEVKSLESFDLFQTGGGIRNTCRSCRSEMSKLRTQLRKTNPVPAPGACPICEKRTETWILDHCHTTNAFRGYICDRCNRGLGCFGDSPLTVKKALDYLSTTVHGTQIKNSTSSEDL